LRENSIKVYENNGLRTTLRPMSNEAGELFGMLHNEKLRDLYSCCKDREVQAWNLGTW
jgi:hypothetical protein